MSLLDRMFPTPSASSIHGLVTRLFRPQVELPEALAQLKMAAAMDRLLDGCSDTPGTIPVLQPSGSVLERDRFTSGGDAPAWSLAYRSDRRRPWVRV